jgi:hypothetical protein
VKAQLPADLLAKLRDLHARGIPIGSDPAFFHFAGGMAVRNLCRERLSDDDLAACFPFGGDWELYRSARPDAAVKGSGGPSASRGSRRRPS